MTTYFIDIAVIAFLLLCNSVLAMSEMAIVSARKARLQQWADSGDKKARLALEIANSPTRTLSSIQIGITLAALLTGIFGGATVADDFADQLKKYSHFAPHADAISMAVVTATLTYISLVVGELVPKRIALNFPEMIAKHSARPLTVFTQAVRPFVWMLTGSTETVVRLLGLKQRKEPPVTEAEVHIMVEQATEAGIFEEVEQEMVASVLRLDIRKVSHLMTPRRDVEWLDIKDDEQEWIDTALKVPHSRLIIAEGSLDHVAGIVETKALIHQKHGGGKIDIQSLLAQPMYVPENISALDLIQKFRESAQQIALVLDEYGGVSGLVSREDVFEAIVGDLPVPGETAPKVQIVKQDDGSWFCDGQLSISEFKDKLKVAELPGEADGEYRTVAGFVLYHLEHVPSEGETFEWETFKFQVIDMDRHRIDKIRISKIKPQTGS